MYILQCHSNCNAKANKIFTDTPKTYTDSGHAQYLQDILSNLLFINIDGDNGNALKRFQVHGVNENDFASKAGS